MPITTLDSVSALVVIDLQKGIASLPTVHPASDIVARTAQLARGFREQNLPVVWVNVTASAPGRTSVALRSNSATRAPDWAELVPELGVQPEDFCVSKWQWGAFHGTSLDHFLRRHSVTQVVFCGIATSIGVESSARSAYDLGYHVVLVSDAMTDLNITAHEHCLSTTFPRMGEIGSTADVLALLAAH